MLTPKIPDALFIQHINHVPLARRLAAQREVTATGIEPLHEMPRASCACLLQKAVEGLLGSVIRRGEAFATGAGMMGRLNHDQKQFSIISLDEAVPNDHPVREVACSSRSELGACRVGTLLSAARS